MLIKKLASSGETKDIEKEIKKLVKEKEGKGKWLNGYYGGSNYYDDYYGDSLIVGGAAPT